MSPLGKQQYDHNLFDEVQTGKSCCKVEAYRQRLLQEKEQDKEEALRKGGALGQIGVKAAYFPVTQQGKQGLKQIKPEQELYCRIMRVQKCSFPDKDTYGSHKEGQVVGDRIKPRSENADHLIFSRQQTVHKVGKKADRK